MSRKRLDRCTCSIKLPPPDQKYAHCRAVEAREETDTLAALDHALSMDEHPRSQVSMIYTTCQRPTGLTQVPRTKTGASRSDRGVRRLSGRAHVHVRPTATGGGTPVSKRTHYEPRQDTSVVVRLPVVAELDRVARRAGISRGEVLRRAIALALAREDRHPSIEEMSRAS